MRSTKAASRYAKALLELAIEQNKVDQVAGDMAYLLQVSKETKEFQLLLDSPIVKTDMKIQIFGELFGQFEEVTTLFINLITRNHREYMLDEIATSFGEQVQLHKGIVPITIISAVALDNATKTSILDKVKRSVKGELEVKEIIDDSLIGGFIVRMGDTQIDASIARQFSNLKQRLTR